MVGPPSLGTLPRETRMATHDRRSSTSTVSAAPGAGSGALVRLGWMVGGPLMILIAGLTILSTPAWTFTVRDAVFWFGAAMALVLRYLDIARRWSTIGDTPSV
jgi:hypothetical protein